MNRSFDKLSRNVYFYISMSIGYLMRHGWTWKNGPFWGVMLLQVFWGNFSQACTSLLEAIQFWYMFFLMQISLLLMTFFTKCKYVIYFLSFVKKCKSVPSLCILPFFTYLLFLVNTSVYDTSHFCLMYYVSLTTIYVCRKSNTKY